MDFKGKATKINLFSFSTIPMRTFHMTWFAFFLCFFGWFGIAPLMAIVRDDLNLTKGQIGNTIIASVAGTVIARLAIGWLCDKIGPRKAYVWLLAGRLAPGDDHRPGGQLRDVPVVPLGDRRGRRFVRHHAVPHVGDVRAQYDRRGERDNPPVGAISAAA